MFGFRRLLGSRRPDECLNTSINWPIVPALRAALLRAPPLGSIVPSNSNVDNNPIFNGQVSIERTPIKMGHEWPRELCYDHSCLLFFLPNHNGSRLPPPPLPNCNDGLESQKGQQVNIVRYCNPA